MSPEDPRHASEAGHEQHIRDNERPCVPCRTAKLTAASRRRKRKTMGYRYMVPLGPQIKATLDSLRAKGATHEDIAKWAGISVSQAWRCARNDAEALVYARTWVRLREMEPQRIVTPIGVTRRIQALQWLGYSFPAIATASGVHHDTILDASRGPRVFLARRVRESIADAYERLSMKPAAGETKHQRAGITRVRNNARSKGYAPPLAWDDIDDPNEQPTGHLTPRSGRRAENVAARTADLEQFADADMSLDEAARQLGISRDALWTWCDRHKRLDLYDRLARGQRRRENQYTTRRGAA